MEGTFRGVPCVPEGDCGRFRGESVPQPGGRKALPEIGAVTRRATVRLRAGSHGLARTALACGRDARRSRRRQAGRSRRPCRSGPGKTRNRRGAATFVAGLVTAYTAGREGRRVAITTPGYSRFGEACGRQERSPDCRDGNPWETAMATRSRHQSPFRGNRTLKARRQPARSYSDSHSFYSIVGAASL
jgi:hypothetical protein